MYSDSSLHIQPLWLCSTLRSGLGKASCKGAFYPPPWIPICSLLQSIANRQSVCRSNGGPKGNGTIPALCLEYHWKFVVSVSLVLFHGLFWPKVIASACCLFVALASISKMAKLELSFRVSPRVKLRQFFKGCELIFYQCNWQQVSAHIPTDCAVVLSRNTKLCLSS